MQSRGLRGMSSAIRRPFTAHLNRASVVRSRLLLVSVVVVGCSSQVGPSLAPSSAPPDGPPAATSTSVPATPANATDGPSARPIDEPLGPEALDILGPMVLFEDLEPGPNDPSPTQIVASIELDNAAEASSIMPQTGGSLSATGSDGTTYTLDIPATALVTGVEITMTPIVAVSTMDASGQPAAWAGALGVRLEPDGLHLFDTARLRLETPTEVADDRWRAIASASGGADAHLYPLLPGADLPTLPITHFSEFIVVDEIDLPVAVSSSIPVGAHAQLEREIVAWQQDDDASLEDARAIRDRYWSYVESILRRSATDCAFAGSGQMARAAGLAKLMSVFGLGADGDVSALQEGLLVALGNCLRELTEGRCFDRNNPLHVTRFIGLFQMLQRLGSDELYDFLSQAGHAPGSALCGDIYGTIIIQERSSGPFAAGLVGRTSGTRTVILDVNMGASGPSAVAGSFTVSGTSSASGESAGGGDCYSARGSESGAGAISEGSDGQPRLTLEPDGSYKLYAPVHSALRSIVQDCDKYPIVHESDLEGSAGCGPHGQLVGRRDGDDVDFSFSFSNPEGTARCSVSGALTSPY